MSKKRKPDDDLADAPQLKPIGKASGKGKGLQKYFQSNAVKASAAGILVLALVLVIGWQIFGGGSETKPARTMASANSSQAQAAPPPMPEVPTESAPTTPDQKDAPADQNAQTGQDSKQGQSPEVQAEVAQSEQAQPESQPQPGGHGRGTTRETVPGAENTSAESKFPDDISKWVKGDFIRARQESNPKLLEAVAYLGEKFPGKAEVAQGLADLLKTPKPLDTNTIYSQTPMPGLLEAVIEALGKNGSPDARETLRRILMGKIPTEDDSKAVDTVLKTLVQNPSAENEKIIVQVITSPEQIRPATTQGTIQPTTMRSSALELVKQNPSEGLTLKLADNLVQKGPEPNDPVMDFLLQDNPAFLNAQLLLYKSEELNPDTKAKLEQYFLNRSSQAIGMTMGIPSGIEGTASAPGSAWTMPQTSGRDIRMAPSGPGSANAETAPAEAAKDKPTDYDRGAYLAKLLWNEPLVGLLSEHLTDVRSLEKSAQDIVLASTLPLNSIRAGMFKMLKKRTGDSPQPLEIAGLSDKVLNDPGLLVVMKLLPRSKTIKTAPIAGAASSTSAPSRTGRYPTTRGRASGADAGGGTPSAVAEAAQKKAQVETEWLTSLSKMVDAWCNRLDSAGQAQKRAIRRGQKVLEQPPTRLDEFEIPQDAKNLKDVKIISAYQLNWPEKAPGDVGKLKPAGLKIQYFRLQMTGMLRKTMTMFKQLAKGGDIHDMSDGQWLESIKNGSQPNTKRSLDIQVTSADKQAVDFTQKEEPIDLQVDILAIEITDPSNVKD